MFEAVDFKDGDDLGMYSGKHLGKRGGQEGVKALRWNAAMARADHVMNVGGR